MNRVCVLLSTYNGEKYVREQMDSLRAQKGVDLKIVVRDDGSTDHTCQILETEYPEAELRKERNVGCERSFMELLYSAPEADYYAFCDQDDVWMEDKLDAAVKKLAEMKGPAIYGCNLMACDEDLKPMKVIHDEKSVDTLRKMIDKGCFFNLHGCVLVWNKCLQEVLIKHRPSYVTAHDTWVNYVGNLIGTMVIDEEPHIYYRLHGNNVSGYAQNGRERLKKGFSRYFGKNHPRRDLLAKELLDGYASEIDRSRKSYHEVKLLAEYKRSLLSRIFLMRSDSIKLKKNPDRIFWRLCILVGSY